MLTLSERLAAQREAKKQLEAERKSKQKAAQDKKGRTRPFKTYSGTNANFAEIHREKMTWTGPHVTHRLSDEQQLNTALKYHLALSQVIQSNSVWGRFQLDILIEMNHFLARLYQETDLAELCNQAFDELKQITEINSKNARKMKCKALTKLIDWFSADLQITPELVLTVAESHADCYLTSYYGRQVMNLPVLPYFIEFLDGLGLTRLSKRVGQTENATKLEVISIAVALNRMHHKEVDWVLDENATFGDIRKHKLALAKAAKAIYACCQNCEQVVIQNAAMYGFPSFIDNPLPAVA
ncbi:hypothetical protein ADP71_31410 [Vitreoscilla sp. C1]|uniref:hypothetical protein n=1 Tax=Vitreoscilla sp. (strain C1) TaxID=96942 RepID=UPI000CDC4422|nr:hypothetical protein [Vitreoscilla sp. C1]AUZ06319.1 hypothetical protein ADP71_31410 [Vitreoscilla sp. C1]